MLFVYAVYKLFITFQANIKFSIETQIKMRDTMVHFISSFNGNFIGFELGLN